MLVKHYSLFYILYSLTFYANRIDTADNGEKEEIPVHSNLSRSCLKFRTWRQSLGAFVIYADSSSHGSRGAEKDAGTKLESWLGATRVGSI